MRCYRRGGCGPYTMLSCNECPASKPEYLNPVPFTNADAIRDMSDDELSLFLGFVAQDAFCYGRGMRERMVNYPFESIESTMAWLRQKAVHINNALDALETRGDGDG